MALPDWAKNYVGIPFKENGRDRDGCDCWGLLTMIWQQEFGKPLPEYTGHRWKPHGSAKEIGPDVSDYVSQFTLIKPEQAVMGDGVLIRMRGHPLHVGLVLEPGWMIHSHEEADSCIEDYRRPTWERRILGFYRYRA